MFDKDKDYRFSFKKYQLDCAKQRIEMGDWAKACDGTKVLVKKDRTEGLIHGNIVAKGKVAVMNGIPIQMPESRERVCYMMIEDWCEEI